MLTFWVVSRGGGWRWVVGLCKFNANSAQLGLGLGWPWQKASWINFPCTQSSNTSSATPAWYFACWSTNGARMLAFLFRSLVINFPFIHWIKTLYKCLTFPFFIPFKKGIKTLHKSLVFLLKDAFKIFLLSKELKPFIKVTISLYRIPFIKGIEILYKGLAFPHKFVNFYSECTCIRCDQLQ